MKYDELEEMVEEKVSMLGFDIENLDDDINYAIIKIAVDYNENQKMQMIVMSPKATVNIDELQDEINNL